MTMSRINMQPKKCPACGNWSHRNSFIVLCGRMVCGTITCHKCRDKGILMPTANYDDWKLDNGETAMEHAEPKCIEDRIADAIDGVGVDDVGSVRFDANGWLFADVSLVERAGLSDGERLENMADNLIEMAARLRCLAVTV